VVTSSGLSAIAGVETPKQNSEKSGKTREKDRFRPIFCFEIIIIPVLQKKG
jgi:hypothetical protein